MSLRTVLTPILDDDRLTRGLDDAEARVLVEWLVDRMERQAERIKNVNRLRAEAQRMTRHARAIARFVMLWCYENSASAALQLAATERFGWPLPTAEVDPCDLVTEIIAWEETPPDERDEANE